MFSIRTQSSRGKSGGRYPQLDSEVIRDFIEQHAVSIRYWRAMRCPCLLPENGQPNSACHSCRGLGWSYATWETEEKYRRAQVHSRQSSKQAGKGGTHMVGGASITFLPGVIPGDGDIVQVCADVEVINDEAHVVGERLTDGSSGEALRFRDVLAVEEVAVYEPTTRNVRRLPASGYVFHPQERRIEVVGATPGTRYSVRYRARPEYIILGDTVAPLLRISHDEALPPSEVLKQDVVYPFHANAVRLDRALVSRERGAVDQTVASTFNNQQGRGPFR